MGVDGIWLEKRAWLESQVRQYRKEYPVYKTYAEALRRILEEACTCRAPNAIVQVRAKSLSSFAQKIIRKPDKYPDPVRHFTDLCGARVITSTQEETDSVCRFIRDNFRIDEANSEDTRSRLRTGEFGYLSVHYIVQVRMNKLLGIPIPREIGDRKAEIQVRTLLQHAWSVMAHDRFYKSEFKVPKALERDMARVAALLEEADGEFERVLGNLGLFAMNYGVHMSSKEREEEMRRRIDILENEPEEANKPVEALRVARLARLTGDWKTIINRLSPFAEAEGKGENPALLLELGHALCQNNRDRRKEADYRRGQSLLEKVARPSEIGHNGAANLPIEKDESRARALYTLAWSYQDVPGQEGKARELYHKAYRCDSANPYHLSSFLEFEIFCHKDRSFVPMLRPALLKAIDTCRAHADAGIELPWAFMAMGRFQLLLGKPYESLAAYAKAIHLCLSGKVCVPEDILDAEMNFVRRINFGKAIPQEEQWVLDFLLLAKAVKYPDSDACEEIKGRALRKKEFRLPVVIVAGGADTSIRKEMNAYKELLSKAFDGFDGTVISGCTTAGIPGIVGGLAERSRPGRRGRFDVIGYLPRSLPLDVKEDRRYHERIRTEGNDFTPRQPLANWFDLLSAGIKPSEVSVLGINGGRIAAFEYRLALALGATVGIADSSGRAASEILPDADWWDVTSLLRLPIDLMTFRAFVIPRGLVLGEEQIEKMGRYVHETFLEENRWKSADRAMKPWEELQDDLKQDNRHHAAYMEEILGRLGYGVRPAKKKIVFPVFKDKEVERMAEMEHGRWNVQRLRTGWKYGPKRNPEFKTHPNLVPWEVLPENIRKYDRDAVWNYPKVLAHVGMEIYPKAPSRDSG